MKCGERVRVRVRTRARERLSLLSRRAEVTVHYCVQRVAELVKVNRSIIPWKVLISGSLHCTAVIPDSHSDTEFAPLSFHYRSERLFPGLPQETTIEMGPFVVVDIGEISKGSLAGRR